MRTQADDRYEPSTEQLHESRRRIRVAGACGATAYLVFLIVERIGGAKAPPLQRAIDVTHDVSALGLCAALLLATYWRRVSDRHVLAMALAVELLLAALISGSVPWATYLHTGHLPGLTWVVPIVILFALLVPAPPLTTMWVTSACVLTMPLGIAVLSATGRIVAHPSNLMASAVAGVVGWGLAIAASRTVYGARRQVAAARRMGGYELVTIIAHGGMGEVWEARHMMLARPAAVKLILPERLQAPAEARDAALQRFTREAKLTASLRSPYTVQLFDFGATDDGALYYAMELLEGMNLEHFVRRFGPVAPPSRAVHWLRQACHSLGEAHARDLTHRDLKPANLIVCTYGRERDFIKVLDFGLARHAANEGDPQLTREGWLVGTPGYMAPELIFHGEASPRSDLYALGCVAYWLLAGVRPFESNDRTELLRQHAQAAAVPLAERAPQPIPPALDAAVMTCLAKDPAERPRDADELSERLAASVPGPPWGRGDADAWWNGKTMGP